jgi:hypothetical protein
MPAIIGHNRINIRSGEPCFIIGHNLVDMFEIGRPPRPGQPPLPARTAYWLVAERVGEEAEFSFNGCLFTGEGDIRGTIIDNFPKGPVPEGWVRRQKVDVEGYELIRESDGKVLFGYEVIPPDPATDRGRTCLVTANIYDEFGDLVAETTQHNFRVHRGPASLGRGGIYIG